MRDAELIPQVQNIANHLWDQYPSNAQAIVNRWLSNKEHFGHA
jgi:ATP-dependent DNA helicase RecG